MSRPPRISSSDEQRLRAAWAAVDSGAPEPSGCPQPLTLWQAAHGELPPRAVARIVDHLATCTECAEAWRLALELEPLAPQPARAPLWGFAAADRRLVPAAAVLLLAFGVLWQVRRAGVWPAKGGPIYRGGRPAAELLTLPPQTRCPVSGCRLEWPAVAGATYRLVIRTPGGAAVLDRAGLAEPRYELTSHDLLGFPPGTHLRWSVTASAQDGTRRESRPAELVLLPDHPATPPPAPN